MFDWVTSKVAMSVAVLILISAMIGFFAIQRTALEELEFQNRARDMANAVNEVGRSPANTTLNITFNEIERGSKTNIYVDAMYRNNPYDISITANNIYLQQSEKRAGAEFHYFVHPYYPLDDNGGPVDSDTGYVSRDALKDADSSNTVLRSKSGVNLIIERKLLLVSGAMEYHTFVYRKTDIP